MDFNIRYRNWGVISVAMLILLVGPVPAKGANGYTVAMFRRAMAKDAPREASIHGRDVVRVPVSATPLYVLIVVKDPKTGTEHEICTLSRLLMGAIADEHRLDVLSDGKKIFDIAMAAPNRTFVFKNPKARKIVAPVYTPEQLAEVRRLLKDQSPSKLRAQAKLDLSKDPGQQSSVTQIYRHMEGGHFWSSDSYKVAVAHVLLENGVLVGELHDTGVLYVDDQN